VDYCRSLWAPQVKHPKPCCGNDVGALWDANAHPVAAPRVKRSVSARVGVDGPAKPKDSKCVAGTDKVPKAVSSGKAVNAEASSSNLKKGGLCRRSQKVCASVT